MFEENSKETEQKVSSIFLPGKNLKLYMTQAVLIKGKLVQVCDNVLIEMSSNTFLVFTTASLKVKENY